MRIIGGTLRGRLFYPPADNWPTRPTTDIAKEALFNILEHQLDFSSLRVLDLFCGTGSHSYEFASRGCTDITAVDKFAPCIAFVKRTAQSLGIAQYIRVVRSDAFRFVQQHNAAPYDYIFAGPPYGLTIMDTLPDLIFKHGLLQPGGIFVLEHNPHHQYSRHPRFEQSRHYGQTIFSFFVLPA